MSNLAAFFEGYIAYLDNKTLDDNPYELLTTEGEAWIDGFEEALARKAALIKKHATIESGACLPVTSANNGENDTGTL